MTRTFLTAEWRYLAMLNYEVDPRVLRPKLPKGTQLDDHDGRHFVSLVGFLFLDTHVLSLPAFFHQNFEEVNLRFKFGGLLEGGRAAASDLFGEMVQLPWVRGAASL